MFKFALTTPGKVISCRSTVVLRQFASGHGHSEDANIVRKGADYKPGTDSYAYDNPWPKLNGGRLDWLFGDGWRRPLAKDQGAKMRREWIWFGQVAHDEHADWIRFHKIAFMLFTVLTTWTTCWIIWAKPDWPSGKEWALREAHLEMARREKAGLPYISKDYLEASRVVGTLPSDAELRDFEVLI
uniref:NADH dehydrogenase [ubiquinone] 1 beta subcomplex subunit 11, mitochondrial n=1 Tax=Rhabditophanes sp. KR3021 TaxID=114890 RepID=A0AC35TUT5_9BILA